MTRHDRALARSRGPWLALPLLLVSALALAACSPLRALDMVTTRGSYVLQADLPYGPHPRQRADVYRPAPDAARAGASLPVAVFFYGGSWREGSKSDYRFVAEALAARGVLVVVPDYRVYPEVLYPEILADSASAVAWALAHVQDWGGDPKRVYVVGHSAGAYNAAMLAIDPRWLGRQGVASRSLAGFVGLAGPYNFLPIENPDVKPVFSWPNTPPDSQPLAHVTAQTAPRRTLLIAPERDKLVDPQRNTEALAQALRAVAAPVDVHRYGALSHVTTVGAFAWPLRPLAPVLDEVADFLLADVGVASVAPGASAAPMAAVR